MSGWGSGPWGAFPWGGGAGSITPASADLSIALTIAENVVRLFFTAELDFTGILGINDASDPSHYVVTPVAGTFGLDGLAARPVGVLVVENVDDLGQPGTVLDITLDRPLSPYPAQYTVAVQNLVTLTSVVLTPANATATFYGTHQPRADLTVDGILPTRDIAHPDTLGAALDPLPDAQDPDVLGSIPVGSDGDYAFDQGITNLKKRVFRRLLSSKGRFLHLGARYGVGIADALKMLANANTRQAFCADAESQIAQEPDVRKVKCRAVFDQAVPELTRFVVLVKTTAGKAVRFDAPFVSL